MKCIPHYTALLNSRRAPWSSALHEAIHPHHAKGHVSGPRTVEYAAQDTCGADVQTREATRQRQRQAFGDNTNEAPDHSRPKCRLSQTQAATPLCLAMTQPSSNSASHPTTHQKLRQHESNLELIRLGVAVPVLISVSLLWGTVRGIVFFLPNPTESTNNR